MATQQQNRLEMKKEATVLYYNQNPKDYVEKQIYDHIVPCQMCNQSTIMTGT